MKEFTSGARSSEAAPRLDLIPLASLLRQAARMAMGAASHGERNYEKGASDPAFILDRKNHLALHVALYISGDESDDHLGAILANAGMLARLEELADVHAAPTVHDVVNTVQDSRITNAPPFTSGRDPGDERTYDEVRAGASKCAYCDRPNLTNPKACAGGCLFARWPHRSPPPTTNP